MVRLVCAAMACVVLHLAYSSCGSAVDESCAREGTAMLQVHRTKTGAVAATGAHEETRPDALLMRKTALAQKLQQMVQEPTIAEVQPQESAACNVQSRNTIPDASFQLGTVHDVVGQDGVLVISLLRKQMRFNYSMEKLKLAGIWPTEFPAADARCLSGEELSRGCESERDSSTCQGRGKTGTGCVSVTEQAVAESHRRALVAAMEREKEWTAILEDDVVPVRPEVWNAAFDRAWKQVPGHVKLVRLSWCHFPDDFAWATLAHDTFDDSGDFDLANWTGYTWPEGRHYNPGLCTSAYMVHRDIIPEMLQLFPCCSAVDSCYLYDFFVKGWDSDGGLPRGLEVMMHLDAKGSTEYSRGFQMGSMAQGGVMVQDTREMPSERES